MLTIVNSVLEKKAQSIIQETQNIAKEKICAINEQLERISEHKVGQRKVYDTAMALVANGSHEEIMLSHKSVEQSMENGAKEYEQTVQIDDALAEYSNEELSNMFLDEIKAIKEGKPGNIFTL